MYNPDLGFQEEVWENLEKVVHIGAQWWLVQVILDCKEICAPESLKVQLTKLLTENNVLYYNLPLPTEICPITQYSKFLKGGKSLQPVLRS